MARYFCHSCGYCYDERCGKKFEDLPDDYVCPKCGNPAACFYVTEADKKIYQLGFFDTLKLFFRSIFNPKSIDKPVLNISLAFNVKNLIVASLIVVLLILFNICFFGMDFNFELSPEALTTTYIGVTFTHLFLMLFCFLRIGKFDLISKPFASMSEPFLLSVILLRALYSTIFVLIAVNTETPFLVAFIFEMWWNLISIPLSFLIFFNIFKKDVPLNENQTKPSPKIKTPKQNKNILPPKPSKTNESKGKKGKNVNNITNIVIK